MSIGERRDGRGMEERFTGKNVTFPYTIINGELYVGLLVEDNGDLHAPFSSLDPGKTHFQFKKITKHRPFWRRQESEGLQPYKIEPSILKGKRMVINADFAESKSFGAIEAYKLRFGGDVMRKVGNAANWENDIYEINTEVLKPVSFEANYIAGCKFLHVHKASLVSDIVTLAGLNRLRQEVLPRFGNDSSIF